MRSRLELHEGDRAELEHRAGDGALRPADRLRAEIVLLAADGLGNAEIAARLGTSRPTAASWRTRYQHDGLAGLRDGVRTGRPRRIDEHAVLHTTLHRPPPNGAAQWTTRTLSADLGISPATVARVWRKFGVTPQLSGSFAFRATPVLEATTVRLLARAKGRRGRVAVLRLNAPAPAGFDGAIERRLQAGGLDPLELVRDCADRAPGVELHVVADPAGQVELLHRSAAATAWWARQPRLFLHSVRGAQAWDLLEFTWSCG